jgi:hypothetical protein
MGGWELRRSSLAYGPIVRGAVVLVELRSETPYAFSGSGTFTFAAGGKFTRALYNRERCDGQS